MFWPFNNKTVPTILNENKYVPLDENVQPLFIWDWKTDKFIYLGDYSDRWSVPNFYEKYLQSPMAVVINDLGVINIVRNRYGAKHPIGSFADLEYLYGQQLLETSKHMKKAHDVKKV